MEIPLVDLRAQYQAIKTEVMAAIENVFDGMQLFLGPQLRAFEQEFAAYCGCLHGIGLQPACSHYGYGRGLLPVTESAAQRIVSLPMYAKLTAGQLQAVVNAVVKAAQVTARI